MSAFMNEVPTAWTREEMIHGNPVLLGFVHDSTHLLAPPGARIQMDELDCARGCWRYAIWDEDFELGPPAISVDEPDQITNLGTAEVVELLPADLQDFVRIEMARQLCRAESFGTPPEGERPTGDRHTQLAGRTMAWGTTELANAFPEECWFEPQEPSAVRIPGTVDELLEKMPKRETKVLSRKNRWAKLRKARIRLEEFQVKVEYEAFVTLASALRGVGGRSERLALRCDRRALDDRHGSL